MYRVMGLDLAAVNSGLAIIEVHYPKYTCGVVHEEALHHPSGDVINRIHAADYISFLASEHSVDVVIIEDYARRVGANNTSAYEHGELGGMVRKNLHAAKLPFYVIPPTSMRSFMEVPPKSPKDFLQTQAEQRLGFTSSASNKTKRSNITDAFIHAHIGSLIHILRNDELEYDFTSAEQRMIFGDKKLVGLKDREGIYYGEED